MTNAEMLADLLAKSGWVVTTETTDEGDTICRPAEHN